MHIAELLMIIAQNFGYLSYEIYLFNLYAYFYAILCTLEYVAIEQQCNDHKLLPDG